MIFQPLSLTAFFLYTEYSGFPLDPFFDATAGAGPYPGHFLGNDSMERLTRSTFVPFYKPDH